MGPDLVVVGRVGFGNSMQSPRPTPPCGQGIRAGSSRSAARYVPSATASARRLGDPALRPRSANPDHVSSDRRLADVDAEHQQLAMDPRCSPRRILLAHVPISARSSRSFVEESASWGIQVARSFGAGCNCFSSVSVKQVFVARREKGIVSGLPRVRDRARIVAAGNSVNGCARPDRAERL
jgi:hypothetical protein